jgi:Na+-translocating ferredoxin:NAD+ oxidoreductase RNF subunit RnfB
MQTGFKQPDNQYVAVLDEAQCDGCKMCLSACNYGALIWVRSDEILLILGRATVVGSASPLVPQGHWNSGRSAKGEAFD